MLLNKTFFIYLSKLFLRYFLITIGFFSVVALMGNVFDVLNRLKNSVVATHIVLKLSLYKLPLIVYEAIPISVFISTLYLFNILAKNHELIIIFGNRISIWKIIQPIILCSFIIGILTISLFQPVSSFLHYKFEKLESKITGKSGSTSISLSETGILVMEELDNEKRVLMARNLSENEKLLKDITLFIINDNGDFIKRVEAKTLKFSENSIILFDTTLINGFMKKVRKKKLILDSRLTFETIMQRFTRAENVSFWSLPYYISVLNKSGLNTINYSKYYYKLFFMPLLLIGVVLSSSCFISINPKSRGYNRKLLFGIITSFIVYSFTSIAGSILSSKAISPAAASILPILLIMVISLFFIVQIHEEQRNI